MQALHAIEKLRGQCTMTWIEDSAVSWPLSCLHGCRLRREERDWGAEHPAVGRKSNRLRDAVTIRCHMRGWDGDFESPAPAVAVAHYGRCSANARSSRS